VTVLKYV